MVALSLNVQTDSVDRPPGKDVLKKSYIEVPVG